MDPVQINAIKVLKNLSAKCEVDSDFAEVLASSLDYMLNDLLCNDLLGDGGEDDPRGQALDIFSMDEEIEDECVRA